MKRREYIWVYVYIYIYILQREIDVPAAICAQSNLGGVATTSIHQVMDAVIGARLAGRGGILQQDRASAHTVKESNVLASRLVELWSWGAISSPILQWLADGSEQDLDILCCAGGSPLLKKLASVGSDGEWAANTRRDLLTVLCPRIDIAAPLSIRVPYCQNKRSCATIAFCDAAVFMPNEIFETLYQGYREFFFHFLAKGCSDFWSSIKAGDPVAANYRKLDTSCSASCVPLSIWGDKVRYTEDGASLHVLCWSPLHSAGSQWQRYFLLAAFPASICCKDRAASVHTMDVFWDYISLGFTALEQGKHPAKDPYGDPWLPGSRQAELADRDIADGHFKGIVWALSSDLEYANSEWGLPHWSANQPCFHCLASRKQPNLNIRDVSMHAPSRRTWRTVPDPKISHPIWKIPAVCAFSYRGDWMHTWEEGVLPHLHASAIHDLCNQCFSGHTTFDRRLAALWTCLQKYFISDHISSLTVSMVGLAESTFPNLSPCKAWESKMLISPMLSLLREVDDGSDVLLHLTRSYECLEHIYSILASPGMMLDDVEAEAIWLNTNEFVQHYDWLAKNSIESGICRYNPVFKLHWMLHCAKSAKWLHPRCYWAYSFEDFCGRIKKLGIACMRGTPARALSAKIGAQYRVVLHCVAQGTM